ncbi:hypothetical protein Dsin_028212 [Dipteronia sinensis]|uniref:Transposase n=1 Tax=Dipteronia sinensis TaxID=43782 RepID=A0AAE0DUB6_9ROSI|nr:hypothetical protein Dsin_028212 [Dipteronia sinensis]
MAGNIWRDTVHPDKHGAGDAAGLEGIFVGKGRWHMGRRMVRDGLKIYNSTLTFCKYDRVAWIKFGLLFYTTGNGVIVVGSTSITLESQNPNDFENADVFTIGVDNKDETEGSRPSNLEVPSTRSRVSSSKGLGIKSSTIHGSYTSLESVVNNVKEVGVSDLFPSKEELHMKISLLAIANHFQFKVNKSTKALLVLTCTVEDCKWRVRATKLKDCESFCVRKYQPEHTCSLNTLHFDHRQASSKLIGHCIKSKFEGASQSYRPNEIIEDMKKQCGMTFSYNKAWRAREVALGLARGSPEDLFSILPLYCHMLERKNPGTVTFLDTDSVNRFNYFFMVLGPSIEGFKSCIRPVVAIDGTFLKCKHQGTLFIATSLDGNNQVYPLAFGIGDSENDQSWHWFFTKLHGLIGEMIDLVFISDRNPSIAKAAAPYAGSIYPVGPMQEWDVPDDVQNRVVQPPKGRKPSGRPPIKRRPSQGEEIVHRKCGRCRGLGHNRQICKAPIPLADQNGNP